MHLKYSKVQIATAIAILFHSIGLVGILFFDKTFFIKSTSFNLLFMFFLIIWTQKDKNKNFWLFLLICFATGFGVEMIGVNTGYLFGEYKYGSVLGVMLKNVPLLIGINWFIVIICSGIFINTVIEKIVNKLAIETGKNPEKIKSISVIVDGATLAVIFDWIMEPVAVKLGYWQWLGNGNIPLFNYICWFIISAFLLFVFQYISIRKQNKFAVNLLLIQAMFFVLLKTFLK